MSRRHISLQSIRNQGGEASYHICNDAMSQQACIGKAAPEIGRQNGSHRPVKLKLRAQPDISNAAKEIVANCSHIRALLTAVGRHLFVHIRL